MEAYSWENPSVDIYITMEHQHFRMGKLTISMVIFNSKLAQITRGCPATSTCLKACGLDWLDASWHWDWTHPLRIFFCFMWIDFQQFPEGFDPQKWSNMMIYRLEHWTLAISCGCDGNITPLSSSGWGFSQRCALVSVWNFWLIPSGNLT